MNIKTISFDEKSSAVLLSGPFDADKLCRKLCSEAGRVIREMHVQGEKGSTDKDAGGGDKPKAAKPVEKGGGKADKKDAGGAKAEKADKDGGGGKGEKGDKKEGGGGKAEKGEKRVKFELDDGPAADQPNPMKPMPPGMSNADLGPLLEKMMRAKQGGPEPPRGHPVGPPPAMMPPPGPAPAQGVAVPSIWPAPAGPVSGYSYNPAQAYGAQPPAYSGGCGGGCQCGSCCKAAAGGGYYGGGAPAYDHQGWYYGGNRQQPCYYQPQQPYHCSEDPNAGCSVM